MGSKLIWIAASFAYGAVSAAIYILACRLRGKRGLLKRALLAFAGYTALGLLIVRILWYFFAN